MIKRFLSSALVMASVLAAQESGPAARAGAPFAIDHLESKGITAWITAGPATDRALVVARLGSPVATRMRGRPLRDVVVESTAKTALVLVERGQGFSVERVAFEGDAEPAVVLPEVAMAWPAFSRSGEAALLLTGDEVVTIAPGGEPRSILRKEDPNISAAAMNPRGTVFATARGGEIELVSADGDLVASLGPGRWPAFASDSDLAFVRTWEEPVAGGVTSTWSEIVIADTASLEPARQVLVLAGSITDLRFAGDGTLLFRHVPGPGQARAWLLHVATGVVRPMNPEDRGSLRSAANLTPVRPPAAAEPPATGALPEPETQISGFFSMDDQHSEYRTAYEESGWDDALAPEEARIHQRLLERFLEQVQWPLRREGAYEPFVASDDDPLRAHSRLPHRGLDLGSRLLHVASGSPAFHAPGTPVFPLYRGGTVWLNRMVLVRDAGNPGEITPRRYRILQEVDLHEGGYLLRVHIAYEHVRPYDVVTAAGEPMPAEDVGVPVTGDEPVGELEALSIGDPTGGWITSDPALRAGGIQKGNHAHVGIGGLYTSFNGPAERARRKLDWYRDRLVPALKRSPGPR